MLDRLNRDAGIRAMLAVAIVLLGVNLVVQWATPAEAQPSFQRDRGYCVGISEFPSPGPSAVMRGWSDGSVEFMLFGVATEPGYWTYGLPAFKWLQLPPE